MKKLTMLVVVLAMAATALAEPVNVIVNGIIQTPWTNGSGRRQIRNAGHIQGTNPATMYVNPSAPDGTLAAGTTVEADGWSELMGGGVAIGTNRYLEMDVYFPSDIYNFSTNALTLYTDPDGAKPFTSPATKIEAMHITIDGASWTWKWVNTSVVNVDGVDTTMAAYNVTQNAWHHLRFDLTTNTLPLVPLSTEIQQLTDASVASGIVMYLTPVNAAAPRATIFVENMAFTPEPATVALLGLGGLALIRRKR